MNLYSIDYYKEIAEKAVSGTGAFLRVSRKDGLFVTDAKRRNAEMQGIERKLTGFEMLETDGLVYLTPKYGLREDLNHAYTEILKSGKDKQERKIREGLALALRLKDQEQIEFFRFLYERMQ